jgi:hypothetical protein
MRLKSSHKIHLLLLLVLGLTITLSPRILQAQEGGGDDVRAKSQNPVSAMYSLPI